MLPILFIAFLFLLSSLKRKGNFEGEIFNLVKDFLNYSLTHISFVHILLLLK